MRHQVIADRGHEVPARLAGATVNVKQRLSIPLATVIDEETGPIDPNKPIHPAEATERRITGQPARTPGSCAVHKPIVIRTVPLTVPATSEPGLDECCEGVGPFQREVVAGVSEGDVVGLRQVG